MEERGRADRMKVELITNVSHDLKTPLTSIINYSDLLCAEPLEGAATDYAQVIRQKAERLKAMVQDVFDLSKATSGNLPLAPKAIDLAKLVRQTLADMDEAIAASALTFKTALAGGLGAGGRRPAVPGVPEPVYQRSAIFAARQPGVCGAGL